jgi:hypothetical protein
MIPAGKPGQVSQRQQTWEYSVSFEFDLRPVLTYKGTVTASSYGNLVARATKAAQKALRPVNVRSLVCVLLERLDVPKEPSDESLETRGVEGDDFGQHQGTQL